MKEGSINFYFLLNVLIKNIIWILLATIIGGGLMYAYSDRNSVTTYTSSLKLLVRNFSIREDSMDSFPTDGEDNSNSKENLNYILSTSAISASKSLIETYKVIIATEDSIQMLISDIQENNGYELKYKPSGDDPIFTDTDDWYKNISVWEIRNSLTMYAVGDTEVLQIDVTTVDYRRTEAFAKAINNKIQEVINENYDIGSVHVIESPGVPYAVAPAHVRNVTIGAIAGFAFAAILFFIIAYVDNTVKSEDDIKEAMGVMPLGEIPDLIEVNKKSYRYYNSRYLYKDKEA